MSVVSAISVVMPVYNAAPYLAESISSILAQTFSNFEFIIIDDASTDATPQILADYARFDNRIIILTNSSNAKIAVSLNRGIEASRASLIVRMDADDWAYPERFAKQYAFMQSHPEVSVCGTAMEEYETGRIHTLKGQGEEVHVRLLFGCYMFHPTVMARRSALLGIGGYSLESCIAEDYDLWVRMAAQGHTLTSLPEVLLRYRMHPNQARAKYKGEIYDSTERIQRRQLYYLGIEPTRLEYDRHLFCFSPCPETQTGILAACAWLAKLNAANEQKGVYDSVVFQAVLDALRENFRVASLRDAPRQYFRRLIRNAVCYGLNLLRFDRKYERAIVHTLKFWSSYFAPPRK